MQVEVETGECASCREPISAWDWVKTEVGDEPWCSVCALISAAPCEVCQELTSAYQGYQVSRGNTSVLVCPKDILTWTLTDRLNAMVAALEKTL